jgi:hypothetical protein
MNKKNVVLHWELNDDTPVDEIVKLARKYKHHFWVPYGEALCEFCVFSDQEIKSEEEAWNIIEAE